ncbi:hypothetical protein PAMP_020574 [Pampus punctatissimus]
MAWCQQAEGKDIGEQTVLHLSESVPQGTHLFFDRFFTTINLLNTLMAKGPLLEMDRDLIGIAFHFVVTLPLLVNPSTYFSFTFHPLAFSYHMLCWSVPIDNSSRIRKE